MTSGTAPHPKTALPVFSLIASCWLWLTEPAASIREPERRRRARLLSALLVVSLGLGLLAFIPTALNPTSKPLRDALVRILSVGLLLLAITYGLSRGRRSTLAAAFTVSIFLASTFASVIVDPRNPLLLAYLILGGLMSSLFLSPRVTVAVFAVTLAGIWFLPVLVPGFLLSNTINAVFLVLMVDTLVVVATATRQQDLRQLEQQSRALAEREERLRAVTQSADEAIVSANIRGDIIAWNRAAQSMFGYTEGEALGQPMALVLAERCRDILPKPWELRRPSGAPRNADKRVEVVGRKKDGQEFAIEYSLVTWHVGEEAFCSAFMRDITERQQASEKLQATVNELEQHNREMTLLTEMGEVLQACETAEEAYAAVAHFAKRFFPAESGALFVYSPSRNDLEALATWGDLRLAPEAHTFAPDACWALRRGRVHRVDEEHPGLPCRHLPQPQPAGYLCVPMMAQGEALGVLHLRSDSREPRPPGEARPGAADLREPLAVNVADHTALALANVRLRETLRKQSIRDPLTGLFNRRYLEETLEREVRRAERSQRPLGVIMFDIDHFKRFNDAYGHEAGDAALRELGALLQTHIRGADIACRYGGEEFTVILPEASLEVTRRRAEELRVWVKQLSLKHDGLSLGSITLSSGIAVFPEHGAAAEALLRVADQALYRAKQEGRDRSIIGTINGGEGS